MSKKLVIVESPAKAKTIGKFLGRNYTVKSSVGHIRDLPERSIGIDIENNFTPKYVLSKGKTKVVAELKSAAKSCDAIYLAPDPDREGEAIAWHLQEILAPVAGDKPVYRVQYNEITRRAVVNAFDNPGTINMLRVDAQQARRVLDRIVGYMVSPMLWRRLRRGLSAGRVQSVALRLVAEREAQIQAFNIEPYWVLGANVRRTSAPLDPFMVKLARVDGEKPSVRSEEIATELLDELKGATMQVAAVRHRENERRPLAPFITSTLQQAASSVCKFSPNRTMSLAQKLYEGVALGAEGNTGLITYMRTDSVSISTDARNAARDYIVATFGERYYPAKPNFFKSRTSAQEAHEAIRPTDVARTPEMLKGVLDGPSLRLYELIWKRFVASQMSAARIAQKTVEIKPCDSPAAEPRKHSYLFTATSSEVIFEGFLKVMALDVRKRRPEGEDEEEENDEVERLPPLAEGDELHVLELLCERKETKPPPRYSEASLIRAMEMNGVGRPSTYASIIETLNSRDYTTREKRLLVPTPLGLEVNNLLVGNLDELFAVGFTAQMEENLDLVEEGSIEWTGMMKDFFDRFKVWLEQAREPPADLGKVNTVLDLLAQVAQWGPEVKRGRRIYSDERFVGSVREQLEAGEKPITDKQLLALVKIMLRYREQVPDTLETLIAMGFQEEVDKEQAAPCLKTVHRRFEILQGLEFSEKQNSFIDSLRSQAELGRNLSERQLSALDRIIAENSAQIPNFDAIRQELELKVEEAEVEPDKESPLLIEMLRQVSTWQEPSQRGKSVFDDHSFFTSVEQQFARRKSLSPRQRQALKRMATRYKAQISNYEECALQLGLGKRSKAKADA